MDVGEKVEVGKLGFWPRFWGGLWAAVALLTVFTFWQQPFLLNLASAFRVQLTITLTLLSLPNLFLFAGKRRLLFLAVPLAIWATFVGYLSPVTPAAAAEPVLSLRVAVANLYSGNDDLSELKAWIEQNPVDILGLLEVTPGHLEQLEDLGFERLVAEPRQGSFGLALLSTSPPVSTSVLGEDGPFPSILAEYERYSVLLTHPMPPINPKAREVGDRQVTALLKLLEGLDKPTLFVGDFNATGWDLRLRPVLEQGYRDGRRGFGLLPTWPAGNPVLGIPIDHILVDERWQVTDCSRGPDIGSDHFPLRVEAQLQNHSSERTDSSSSPSDSDSSSRTGSSPRDSH